MNCARARSASAVERPSSAPGCSRQQMRRGRGSSGTKQHQGNGEAGSTNENISVAIRVRPLTEKEEHEERHATGRWTFDEHRIVQETECSEAVYHFDRIFPPAATTNQIYLSLARDIVHSAVVKGYNGCVLAYGQTASGKTFTMLGEGRHLGITPLAIKDVFAHIAKVPSRSFTVRASYLEIYNEEIHDLLDPGPTRAPVKLRGGSDGVFIEGLSEQTITSVRQALSLIVQGEERRKVAATDWNDHSSRSHTLFRLSLESTNGKKVTDSVLYLVDLAGSECIGQLGNETRRIECRQINRSLAALSRVILTLARPGLEGQHVPFRDSKLTRILQPALGGNCRTAIVCTVTPAYCQAEETVNTIRFAKRAQHVALRPEVNVVLNNDEIIQKQEQEIQALKRRLEQCGGAPAEALESAAWGSEREESIRQELLRSKEIMGQQAQELAQQRRARKSLEAQVLKMREQTDSGRASPAASDTTEDDKDSDTVKVLQRKVQRLRARAVQQHKSSLESKERMAALEQQVGQLSTQAPARPSTSWQHVVPDLASVVSAVESGNQANITDAILWLVLATGVNMELVGPSHGPRGVLVCISSSRDAIRYLHLPGSPRSPQRKGSTKEEVWHSIPMSDIIELVQGQSNGSFGSPEWRMQELEARQRSFSLLCREYSLDLIAPSAVAFDLWVEGLERILDMELRIGNDIPAVLEED